MHSLAVEHVLADLSRGLCSRCFGLQRYGGVHRTLLEWRIDYAKRERP